MWRHAQARQQDEVACPQYKKKTTPWLHMRIIGKIVSNAGLIDLVVFAPVISRNGATNNQL